MIRTNIWEILTSEWGRNDFVSGSKLDIKKKKKSFNSPGCTEGGFVRFSSNKTNAQYLLMHFTHDFYFISDVKHGITHHATKKESV